MRPTQGTYLYSNREIFENWTYPPFQMVYSIFSGDNILSGSTLTARLKYTTVSVGLSVTALQN